VKIDDLTVGQLRQSVSKYRPYLLTVLAVFLLAVVLPGTRQGTEQEDLAATGGGFATTQTTVAGQAATSEGGAVDAAAAPAAGGTAVVAGAGGGGAAGGAARSSATAPTAGGTAAAGPVAPAARAAGGADAALAARDCDPATGRIKIPSVYAPNCVPEWDGVSDPGPYYRGVTKNTVKVVQYDAEENAQAAALAAAPDDTTPEEDAANQKKLIEAYEAHFETYGRTVEIVTVKATGPEDDDEAAKADAIKIATEIKAFAVFGGPGGTNAFADELAARGVLCFCTVSQPIENYQKWAPYVWSDLMASTQGYVHRAEYVCKKLQGRPPKHYGNSVPEKVDKTKPRVFGIMYYETADGAFKAGIDFFNKELAGCGAKMKEVAAFTGANINPTATQEQARTIIAKFKDSGVSSALFSGDPLSPIFFTQEATKAAYQPEWIITGSALTDVAFFARTYDQTQWGRAFGISYLTARVDESVTENELTLAQWHGGAKLTSSPAILGLGRLYTGMHLAGPRLNPETFRDGLFSFKPTKGFITRFATSYGRTIWPFDDYLAADDATEIWWDTSARGKDETGVDGAGLYRYVDGGKRFLPGEWPAGEPKAFVTDGTTLLYTERPPQDRLPEYPHEDVHVRGPNRAKP
jgi:hypothetical protein